MKPAVLFCDAAAVEKLAQPLGAGVSLEALVPDVGVGETLANLNVASHSLSELLTDGMRRALTAQAHYRLQAIREGLHTSEFRAAYPEIEDRKWTCVTERIMSRLRAAIPEALTLCAGLRAALCEFDLRLAVFGDTRSLVAQTLIHTARRLGLPTLEVGAESGESVCDRVAASEGGENALALARDMMTNPRRYTRPVDRYPEFEAALARAIPESARDVLVAGIGAACCAQTISARLHGARLSAVSAVDRADEGGFDAVVLAAPLANDPASQLTLVRAVERTKRDGVIIGVFPHGANAEAMQALLSERWTPPRAGADAPNQVGAHCPSGIALLLSRAELEVESATALRSIGPPVDAMDLFRDTGPDEPDPWVDAWVIRGRRRPPRRSPYAVARAKSRALAEAANQEGEKLFEGGDVEGALTQFMAAIGHFNGEARYFNNVAVTLYALGQPVEAWNYALEALHRDPFLQSARDNLRSLGAALGKQAEAERVLFLYGADEGRGSA